MNDAYKLLKYDFENLKEKLEKLIDYPPKGGFEEKIVYSDCQNVIDKLQDAICDIEHYSKPVAEGKPRKMGNDKFELINSKGMQIRHFSCGSSIECMVEIEGEKLWASGRVEYTSKDDYEGYYFYCRAAGHPFLYDGMKARIRK
jgi:hypothetical protein